MNMQETDLNQVAHERVAVGAAALDEIQPEWIEILDPDKLHMGFSDRDVIGQVFGSYDLDRNRIARSIDPENAHLYHGGERSGDDPELPVVALMARYGFTLLVDTTNEESEDWKEEDSEGVTFADLNAAWRFELRERLETAEEPGGETDN